MIAAKRKTLHDGADCHATAETLCELVADVARVEVGEHEHIGVTCDGAVGGFLFPDAFDDSGVELELSVHIDVGVRRLDEGVCRADLVHALMLRAALCREGKHRDFGLDFHNLFRAEIRRLNDVGKLFGCGIGNDRAVREDERGSVGVFEPLGGYHDKAAGNALDAGRRLDDLERRSGNIRGGEHSAADHAVHIAAFERRAGKEHIVAAYGAQGDFLGHALFLAELVKLLGVLLDIILVGGGVHELHALELEVGVKALDFVFVADQHHGADLVAGEDFGRLRHAGVVAFRKRDCLFELGSPFEQMSKKLGHKHLNFVYMFDFLLRRLYYRTATRKKQGI